jgi:hypothetical protein
LNRTYLALNLSHYVNGVAKRHGLVSQHMFGRYVISIRRQATALNGAFFNTQRILIQYVLKAYLH